MLVLAECPCSSPECTRCSVLAVTCACGPRAGRPLAFRNSVKAPPTSTNENTTIVIPTMRVKSGETQSKGSGRKASRAIPGRIDTAKIIEGCVRISTIQPCALSHCPWAGVAALPGKVLNVALDICLQFLYITNQLNNQLVKYKNDADDHGHP